MHSIQSMITFLICLVLLINSFGVISSFKILKPINRIYFQSKSSSIISFKLNSASLPTSNIQQLQRPTSLSSISKDPNSSNESNMKLGVLLLNLGGPETMKDVEGFLYNLFADPDIIRLPSFLSILQKPLAYFIAKRRAPKSSEAYRTIGGGSPIVKYTRSQAQ